MCRYIAYYTSYRIGMPSYYASQYSCTTYTCIYQLQLCLLHVSSMYTSKYYWLPQLLCMQYYFMQFIMNDLFQLRMKILIYSMYTFLSHLWWHLLCWMQTGARRLSALTASILKILLKLTTLPHWQVRYQSTCKIIYVYKSDIMLHVDYCVNWGGNTNTVVLIAKLDDNGEKSSMSQVSNKLLVQL